jgi:hypothetical protein
VTPVTALVLLLPAGVLAGLAGTVVMDVPMARHREGWTPAFVAASVLRRTDPGAVAFRDAAVVHHAAGVAAGVLYALVAAPLSVVLGDTPATPGVAVLPVVAHGLAVAVVVGFVYGFFAYVVFPRAGRGIDDDRGTEVRGQWIRSVAVFGATFAVAVPAAAVAVG